MRTNRIVAAAVGAIAGFGFTTAHATNGYQLIGVGAYQKGMGGAVTANPQSAMTAISNPAGMAAIGDRADFSMEAFMPERTSDFSDRGGESVDSEMTMYGVPSIGWTAPLADGSDFYFGGGMYGTSGMGVDYGQTKMMPDANGPATGEPDAYWDGYSNISFWQMAPTLAWKVDDNLDVGASLNIDYQSVAFQQRMIVDGNNNGINPADGDNQVGQEFDLSRGASAFGFGISLGALYEVTPELMVGASYKSKQSFSDLEYQLSANDIYNVPDGENGAVASKSGTYKLGMDFPQQAALGISYTPLSQMTVSADVKWINWSDTMDELEVKGDYVGVNDDGTYTGSDSSNNAVLEPNWDDQIVYALGVDYQFNKALSVRAGYNYAESPIGSNDVSANLLLPAVVESHFTAGATYAFNNRWELSGHYMYVPENSVSNDTTEISLSETSAGFNIGYRF